MNAKKSLFSYMKKKKVSIDDIEYIITPAYKEEDTEDMEIDKDDFLSLMENLEADDLTLGIKLIGKNFYITSDIDDAHENEGYWGIVRLPPRPNKKVNVAKMALLSGGGEDDLDLEEIVGLKFVDWFG